MRKLATLALITLAGLAPAGAQTDMQGLPVPLTCFGTEPFWGLTIRDSKTAAYNWDHQITHWHIERVDRAMMRPETWRIMFKGDRRHAIVFNESNGVCSDSDADEEDARGFGLILEDGDGFLRGCCSIPE